MMEVCTQIGMLWDAAVFQPNPQKLEDLCQRYRVQVYLDEDGYLSVYVESKDGTPLIDVDADIEAESPFDLCYRFSTRAIEDVYVASIEEESSV